MHRSKVHDSNYEHATRTRLCETNTFKRNWVLEFDANVTRNQSATETIRGYCATSELSLPHLRVEVLVCCQQLTLYK